MRHRRTADWSVLSIRRRRFRRCSRRALKRHEPFGHRDARTQRPFHVAHKLIARVFPGKMKPPEPRVEEGSNGRHLSWGRKRVARLRPGVAGPVQEASRRAMLRIMRVKGFQIFSVSLSSVPRPAPPANGCGRSARKSRQHRPDARLTRRGLPRRAHQPIRRCLRPKAFALPKPTIDHRKVLGARLRPRSSTL